MYNVKITVENLKVPNDRCTGKFKIFKNIMIMNMIVYPYKKESESTPILPDSKQSKIDLNQFINLTRCKDMRKISLKGLFCPKSLESKQIILAMRIILFFFLFVTDKE